MQGCAWCANLVILARLGASAPAPSCSWPLHAAHETLHHALFAGLPPQAALATGLRRAGAAPSWSDPVLCMRARASALTLQSRYISMDGTLRVHIRCGQPYYALAPRAGARAAVTGQVGSARPPRSLSTPAATGVLRQARASA